jgi:hypothetical protein
MLPTDDGADDGQGAPPGGIAERVVDEVREKLLSVYPHVL